MTSDAWPLGDDPIDGSDSSPDILDRSEFVRHIVAVLDRVRRQGESSVVGLAADWGAGKSSVVNMTKRLLEEDQSDRSWLIAEYNPWNYSDFESLIMGFFAELRDAMPDNAQWSESRENMGKLAKAVSPLGKIGGIIGVDVESVVGVVGDMIAGDVSVSAKKAKAEKALEKLDRPILVILDDLDRLAPAELLLVFKLVKLVGHLRNTYYLLCYDEQTLLDVLRRTDLVGDDLTRARDYMEKMVQVRIDLPPLRETQISEYVDRAISGILRNHGVELDHNDVERISAAYRAHLRDRLATPRAMKRFFAQVDAFYSVLGGEVNFADYLILTFLRTAEPGVYRMLYLHKEELMGLSPKQVTGRVPTAESIGVWRTRIEQAGVSMWNINGVLGLLSILFSAVHSVNQEMSVSLGLLQDGEARCGIGNPDYFDRYFAFGVPAEDIADSVVTAAMRQLSRNAEGAEVEELSRQLLRDTDKVVRKIQTERDRGPVPVGPLIGILARSYDQVPSGHLFTSRPQLAITLLACTLLGDLGEADGRNALLASAATDGGRELAIRAVRTLRQAQASGEEGRAISVSWTIDAEEVMLEIIKERLTNAVSRPLTEIPCSLFKELLWGWHSLSSSDVRSWLWAQVDSGHWPLVDLIIHYSSLDRAADGRALPHPVFTEINFDEIDGLLGLSRIFETLNDELDAAVDTKMPRADADPDQARRYVLWLLADRRRRLATPTDGRPPVTLATQASSKDMPPSRGDDNVVEPGAAPKCD